MTGYILWQLDEAIDTAPANKIKLGLNNLCVKDKLKKRQVTLFWAKAKVSQTCSANIKQLKL